MCGLKCERPLPLISEALAGRSPAIQMKVKLKVRMLDRMEDRQSVEMIMIVKRI